MAVHLFTGDDESLLRSAVGNLVQALVGDGDRALMVDEFDGDEYTVAGVVDAAQTAPFLTESRVVVARNAGRFNADELAPLLGYLADPLDTTELVIEWGNQRRTKAFSDALAAAGATIVSTAPPNRARERGGWVADEAAKQGVRLTPDAVNRLVGHLGENVSSLDGVLRTLASTFGPPGGGATPSLGPDDVEPFLGDAGGVPPWDLTDAIDGGRTGTAIDLLGRMMGAGERHPLQVMAILQSHYGKLATLDGRNLRSEAEAAAALGIKPGYPAKKALELSRRMGSSSIRKAIDLLAGADLDLRGGTELDDVVVMEILVARLSRLARA
jgi:DNA polymerase-3 subunit delta